MKINWWILTFDSTNMLDHFWVLAFVLVVILHVRYKPIIHLVFGDFAVVVLVALFDGSVHVFLRNESAVPVQSGSRCLFVDRESHPDEVPRLLCFQISTSVFIILSPNLVDKMRNNLLVFTAVHELFKQFSCVNSFFVGLAHEGCKNKLRHIFNFNILQVEMLTIFVLGNNDCFGVFHELIIGGGVVLFRLLFVEQLACQVNHMEQIIQMNLIRISLLVGMVVVIVFFVIASFERRSPNSFENELTFP